MVDVFWALIDEIVFRKENSPVIAIVITIKLILDNFGCLFINLYNAWYINKKSQLKIIYISVEDIEDRKNKNYWDGKRSN